MITTTTSNPLLSTIIWEKGRSLPDRIEAVIWSQFTTPSLQQSPSYFDFFPAQSLDLPYCQLFQLLGSDCFSNICSISTHSSFQAAAQPYPSAAHQHCQWSSSMRFHKASCPHPHPIPFLFTDYPLSKLSREEIHKGPNIDDGTPTSARQS